MAQKALANWTTGAPRTILLATDRSARCDRPIDRAVQLAHDWRARLVVLHVIERLPHGADAGALTARLKTKLFDEMPARNTPFQVEVRIGAVGETLLAAAADVGADLIITGVARYDEIGDYVLGTTVDRLVRASQAPVLVVKERPRTGYKKLMVATDYSACAAYALQVLPSFPRAEVTLMHAYHVPFDGFLDRETDAAYVGEHQAAEADAFLSRVDPAIRARLAVSNRYGEPASALIEAAQEDGFDLAIVGTHGTGGLGRILIGSTADLLLAALPCDVLMVPAPR